MQHHTLKAEDELVFPLHKRAILQYSEAPSGSKELHLYYGNKEISFDEPELFDFGENLAKQSRFIAKTATEWGNCYDWPRVQALLEQLINEGILHYANDYIDHSAANQDIDQPSPLPPAFTKVPHTWLECEAITSIFTGRPLELAYLESAIPIFRIAHIAMDTEGRQIGEANVFPKALRLDIPTEWRTCPYSGSRYMDERPMNATALKSISNYWPQILVALLHVRRAYLERFPAAQKGWSVADLEVLSTLILALPTYLLMRHRRRIVNGELHPALSSLFRVTDGLRVIMHQIAFMPSDNPSLSIHTPITSTEIYEFAERNHAFFTEHGVCAAPKTMIEEFLRVLVDGIPSIHGTPVTDMQLISVDAQVQSALDDIDPAIDYGLYGLQTFCIAFSIWPIMAQTYEQLLTLLENWSYERSETLIQFQQHIRIQIDRLQSEQIDLTEPWRAKRVNAFSTLFAHCRIGLGKKPEDQTLSELISPAVDKRHKKTSKQLKSILQQRFGQVHNPDIETLSSCLMRYFAQVQSILRSANQIQESINKLLDRPSALNSFDACSLNTHNLLQDNHERRLAFLTDEIENILALRIHITDKRIDIFDLLT
jgi:hypothetical protein